LIFSSVFKTFQFLECIDIIKSRQKEDIIKLFANPKLRRGGSHEVKQLISMTIKDAKFKMLEPTQDDTI
jgi:hypothetical protein